MVTIFSFQNIAIYVTLVDIENKVSMGITKIFYPKMFVHWFNSFH